MAGRGRCAHCSCSGRNGWCYVAASSGMVNLSLLLATTGKVAPDGVWMVTIVLNVPSTVPTIGSRKGVTVSSTTADAPVLDEIKKPAPPCASEKEIGPGLFT